MSNTSFSTTSRAVLTSNTTQGMYPSPSAHPPTWSSQAAASPLAVPLAQHGTAAHHVKHHMRHQVPQVRGLEWLFHFGHAQLIVLLSGDHLRGACSVC